MRPIVAPITGFDNDGRPVRPLPFYRLKVDGCEYRHPLPPCQMMPLLVSTSGIQLGVSPAEGVVVTLLAKQATEMMREGIFLWADKDVSPRPVPWSDRPLFLVHVSRFPERYAPHFVQPLSLDEMNGKTGGWVRWRRDRCTLWVPKEQTYE